MRLIKTIVRQHKLEEVRRALEMLGVPGLTVSQVQGTGKARGDLLFYRGVAYAPLRPSMQLELVVGDELVDDTVRTIISAARTGAIGDGMVFVSGVDDCYRIRTGDWEG
jgi:nitrogen regulatory protein PII